MPIIVFLVNGTQFIVKGEQIVASEWKGKRMISKTDANGREMLINPAAVNAVELVLQSDYDQMIAEAKERQKESAYNGKAGLVRPAMAVPGRHR